jgi:hypothetical protein
MNAKGTVTGIFVALALLAPVQASSAVPAPLTLGLSPVRRTVLEPSLRTSSTRRVCRPKRIVRPRGGRAALRAAAAEFGWSSQTEHVLYIAKHESGFRVGARSRTGKYQGLGQLGPGPRRRFHQRTGDAMSEARAMMGYIKARYRTPARAYLHKRSWGWY